MYRQPSWMQRYGIQLTNTELPEPQRASEHYAQRVVDRPLGLCALFSEALCGSGNSVYS